MDLREFDGGWVSVVLEVSECATLARLCQAAVDSLQAQATNTLSEAARTYGAAFRAMAVSSLGMVLMPPATQADEYTSATPQDRFHSSLPVVAS